MKVKNVRHSVPGQDIPLPGYKKGDSLIMTFVNETTNDLLGRITVNGARMTEKFEGELPMCDMPRTDKEEPTRAQLRRARELPKCTKFEGKKKTA